MKITCVANSNLRLLMEPETVLETAFLKEMAGQSEKGTTTMLNSPEDEGKEYILEVGKS